MYFNVYIEKEIFEEICLLDDYPNWKKIFSKNTQILLNMTEDDLDKELEDLESPIFLFQDMNAAAVPPIALDSQFEAMKDNTESLINHPRAAFIFDVEPEEAAELSKDLGVALFSSKRLDDNYFKSGGLFRDLESGQTIEGGWKSLLSKELPVSNALVISDNYLFKNEENNMNCGLGNLPKLLDAFLPQQLKTDYHITILAQNGGKGRSWWIKKFGALKAEILQLRDYDIKLELAFTETIHKRRFLSNYMNGWADKGFSIFKNSNPDVVRDYNDIHLYRVFDNIDNIGDSYYQSASKGLKQIREICDKLSDDIKKISENESAMIFGDCNKDKTIRNRLLS